MKKDKKEIGEIPIIKALDIIADLLEENTRLKDRLRKQGKKIIKLNRKIVQLENEL